MITRPGVNHIQLDLTHQQRDNQTQSPGLVNVRQVMARLSNYRVFLSKFPWHHYASVAGYGSFIVSHQCRCLTFDHRLLRFAICVQTVGAYVVELCLWGNGHNPPGRNPPRTKSPPEKVTPDRIPPQKVSKWTESTLIPIFFHLIFIFSLLGLYVKK